MKTMTHWHYKNTVYYWLYKLTSQLFCFEAWLFVDVILRYEQTKFFFLSIKFSSIHNNWIGMLLGSGLLPHVINCQHFITPSLKSMSASTKNVKRKQMWDSQKFDCCHSWDLAFSCRQTSAIEKPLPNIKGTPKKCWCTLWIVPYSFYTWIKP